MKSMYNTVAYIFIATISNFPISKADGNAAEVGTSLGLSKWAMLTAIYIGFLTMITTLIVAFGPTTRIMYISPSYVEFMNSLPCWIILSILVHIVHLISAIIIKYYMKLNIIQTCTLLMLQWATLLPIQIIMLKLQLAEGYKRTRKVLYILTAYPSIRIERKQKGRNMEEEEDDIEELYIIVKGKIDNVRYKKYITNKKDDTQTITHDLESLTSYEKIKNEQKYPQETNNLTVGSKHFRGKIKLLEWVEKTKLLIIVANNKNLREHYADCIDPQKIDNDVTNYRDTAKAVAKMLAIMEIIKYIININKDKVLYMVRQELELEVMHKMMSREMIKNILINAFDIDTYKTGMKNILYLAAHFKDDKEIDITEAHMSAIEMTIIASIAERVANYVSLGSANSSGTKRLIFKYNLDEILTLVKGEWTIKSAMKILLLAEPKQFKIK